MNTPLPPSADLLAESARALQLAQAGQLPLVRLLELAGPLAAAGHRQEAEALYRSWLANDASPQRFVALFNLGVLLGDSGRAADAIACYREALQLNPAFAQAGINLGSQLEALGDVEGALAAWRHTLALLPALPAGAVELGRLASNSIGRVAEQLRRYDEAEIALAASLALDPAQPDVIQHWIHLRQKQCKWPVHDAAAVPGLTENALLLATSPLAMLAAFDDPALHLMAARNFVQRKFATLPPPMPRAAHAPHRRLRIGYLGGNLCVHAVGLLLADVLEQQDRAAFESYAFCYSPEDGTAHRARLLAAFDHVERVAALDDEQLAQLIVRREIDVLVDLHGLSDGVRAGVLSRRPAPVQVTWLGFIGPCALPFIDHVIADRFSLPESQRMFYAELPCYLPQAVMPLARRPAPLPRTRAELGLPEHAFVYASFNNVYKLNPRMFGSWMRILERTPGSVLWLLDDNPVATANLRDEAARHGVDPARLVFAPRVGHGDYLARFQCADLFLDNHPYNAGSTAADALGSGLPLLTLAGSSFVARMAGAMLQQIGLDELVTTTHAQYEEAAVRLWREPALLASLRDRLVTALQTHEACRPAAYMQSLERVFRAVAS